MWALGAAARAGDCGCAPRVPALIARSRTADVAAAVRHGAELDGIDGEQVRVYVAPALLEELQRAGVAIALDEELMQRITDMRMHGAAALGYHTFEEMTNVLTHYAHTYSNLCRLVRIGRSVQQRDLWMLKISDHPELSEDEPGVRFISTMHGDEPVGLENCLRFIETVLSNYTSDARWQRLVNECELWIMPLMNPDGFVAVRRENAQGVDLNRSFPDRVRDPNNSVSGRPPETAAVMLHGLSNTLTLSANFHGGALVVNYPYDGRNDGADWPARYVACSDDRLFITLARAYADGNPRMKSSNGGAFTNGICNGAHWYPVYGGLQDWSYTWPACFDVTVELDNQKIPSATRLPALWAENMTAMLAYAEWSLRGVRGVVSNAWTGEPVAARIVISNHTRAVFSSAARGNYHRMLLPGVYSMTVSAEEFVAEEISGISVGTGEAVRVDVALQPLPEPAWWWSTAGVLAAWRRVRCRGKK